MVSTFNWQLILPEIILVGTAFVLLIGGVFSRWCRQYAGVLTFLGVIAGAFFLTSNFHVEGLGPEAVSGMIVTDPFSAFFRAIILLVAGVTTFLSMGYQGIADDDRPEYYFFLLTVAASMMLAVTTTNLMMIYITLEAVSIISYILAGYLRRDALSSEAGIKYFLFGAVATGTTLYGISLLYGLCGTLDLTTILHFREAVSGAVLFVAFALILAGFAFKCSLVPFHMWTPDVYEGAPTPVAAFLSVGPKAMGFALLARVFTLNQGLVFPDLILLFSVIAVLTMTIGNIAALTQTNIKRLLAYSTIAQAGYIFVGLVVGGVAGFEAVFFYILIYTLMNLGAFGAVIMISNFLKSDNIEDYAGFFKKDPVTAVILAVSLLSLAGLPPLAGFLAKFLILAAAVKTGFMVLAGFVVLNSLVAFYYYVRVLKFVFIAEPRTTLPAPGKSPAFQATLVALAGSMLIIGLWPGPVLNWLGTFLR